MSRSPCWGRSTRVVLVVKRRKRKLGARLQTADCALSLIRASVVRIKLSTRTDICVGVSLQWQHSGPHQEFARLCQSVGSLVMDRASIASGPRAD